jgi:hypothetical protein
MFFAERSIEQVFVILPLALSFFVPFYYKFYDYSVVKYYSKFERLIIGQISKKEYLATFGPHAERNYEIANFLVSSSLPTDKVFMLDSDSPVVYALSRRLPPIKYVADYHIFDFSSLKDAAQEIAQNPPKFVILTSIEPFPQISPLIKRDYLLIDQIENANIYVKITSISQK